MPVNGWHSSLNARIEFGELIVYVDGEEAFWLRLRTLLRRRKPRIAVAKGMPESIVCRFEGDVFRLQSPDWSEFWMEIDVGVLDEMRKRKCCDLLL